MSIEYQSIETDLKKLEIELEQHYPIKDDDNIFSTTMHRFYKDATTEFKRIVMLSTKMDESYERCVRFYGEDPHKMQPDEFFGIFKEFVTSWGKCSAVNKEARLRQDRLERQKIRKRVSSTNKESAILHCLLDKLKKDTVGRKRGRHRSVTSSIPLSSQNPSDSTYAKANRMLSNIQTENRSFIEEQKSAAAMDERRKSSPSIPTTHYNELLLNAEEDKPITEEVRSSSDIVMPTTSHSTRSFHLTPSMTTATKPVRVRKTSKRPIFDHNLRVRGRRTSIR